MMGRLKSDQGQLFQPTNDESRRAVRLYRQWPPVSAALPAHWQSPTKIESERASGVRKFGDVPDDLSAF